MNNTWRRTSCGKTVTFPLDCSSFVCEKENDRTRYVTSPMMTRSFTCGTDQNRGVGFRTERQRRTFVWLRVEDENDRLDELLD